MPLSLAYWIVLLLWLLGGFWWGAAADRTARIYGAAWGLGLFLLFLILGMKLFGAPIHS